MKLAKYRGSCGIGFSGTRDAGRKIWITGGLIESERLRIDAWWPYSLPERNRKHTLKTRIQQVLEDVWGCL